ncbi:hypothetical protein E0401_24685 [Escherichia coli]|nr:hypothetical protein [Escherichia coli]EFA5505876.1 hypothetical protein [Escherichia coli]EFB5518973.1 hypothetical protein [Escherichia coli]EFD5311125.1 hypothetical protein [Escherichia coli]
MARTTVFADSVQWKRCYIIYLNNKFNTNFRRCVGELMTDFQRGGECMEFYKEKIVIVQLAYIAVVAGMIVYLCF